MSRNYFLGPEPDEPKLFSGPEPDEPKLFFEAGAVICNFGSHFMLFRSRNSVFWWFSFKFQHILFNFITFES